MQESLKNCLKTGHVICICEGNSEEVIIKKLFYQDKLAFKQQDFFDGEKLLRIFTRTRQGKKFAREHLNQDYGERPINILRIIDSRNEKFSLERVYDRRIELGEIKVFNILTRPEIEILMIINANHYKDFTNRKGKEKASEYFKRLSKSKSVKSETFISNYFEDVEVLIKSIEDYNKLHSSKNDEIGLFDILD